MEERENVLLVCSTPETAESITARLDAMGLDFVGPVSRAASALCLAATTAPTVALIAETPTGRRGAEELASSLMANWGVGSVILQRALSASDARAVTTDEPAPLARLRSTFAGRAP